MRLLCCLALTCCLRILAADTGDELALRVWTSAKGLPDNSIRSLTQTHDGRLWVLTETALGTFDGLSFHPLEEAAMSRLSAALPEKLLAGHDGELFIATRQGGLFRWKDGLLTETGRPGAQEAKSLITSLCQDHTGSVWTGRRGGLIEGYTSAGRLTIQTDTPAPQMTLMAGTADGTRLLVSQGAGASWLEKGRLQPVVPLIRQLAPLCQADARSFWVGIGSTLQQMDLRTGQLTECASLPDHAFGVASSVTDSEGTLWLGFITQGLHRFASGKLEHVPTVSSSIRCLTVDDEGTLWAGTEGQGLQALRPRNTRLIRAPQSSGVPQIIGAAEDESGVLWLAARGRELFAKKGKSVPFRLALPELAQELRALCPASDSGVWLGTLGQGLWKVGISGGQRHDKAGDLPSPRIRVLLPGQNGDLWIGTEKGASHWTGTAYETLPLTSLPAAPFVRALALDAEGVLFIGTEQGQIIKTGTPDRIMHKTLSPITAMLFGSKGELWFATESGGLQRLTERWPSPMLGPDQGIPAVVISALLPLPGGRLGIGSRKGIFVVRMEDLNAVADELLPRLNAVVVGADEGMEGITTMVGSQPVALMRRNSWAAFATTDGLVEFDPHRLDEQRPVSRLLVRHMGQEKAALETLWISGGHAAALEAGVLSYRAPSAISLRWKVEGHDEGWRHAASSRILFLGAPPPGRYLVRVQACNNSFNWEEPGITIAWLVKPRLWQTPWFHTVLVMLAASAAFLIWRRMVHVRLGQRVLILQHEQSLANERARIARDMHDAVGARLTQLSLLHDLALADRSFTGAAREKLRHASTGTHEVAMVMDEIVWSLNPKNDTLPSLIRYLARVMREYLEPLGIACLLELPLDAPARAVSSTARHAILSMVKECLQNIAKHAHATQVQLAIRIEAESLRLTLADNGTHLGDAPPSGDGHDGLGNLHGRAAGLGGEFSLQRKAASTEARITLPLSRIG